MSDVIIRPRGRYTAVIPMTEAARQIMDRAGYLHTGTKQLPIGQLEYPFCDDPTWLKKRLAAEGLTWKVIP